LTLFILNPELVKFLNSIFAKSKNTTQKINIFSKKINETTV